MRTAEKKGIKIHVPGPDPSRFSWDQVKISMLGEKNGHAADNRNNHSLVTRLEFLSFSMLFPGDIEEKRERELLHAKNFGLRITSYNVCYTKLLRLRLDLKQVCQRK